MNAEGLSSENDCGWDTDDELEVFGVSQEISSEQSVVESSCTSTSDAKHARLIHLFVGMGFPKKAVIKAVEQNGEDNEEDILETLLALSSIIEEPSSDAPSKPCTSAKKSDHISNDISGDDDSTFGDEDCCPGAEDNMSEKDETLSMLVNMGYPSKEALKAIDKCGPEAQLSDLTDFICASQLEKEIESHLQVQPYKKHDASIHKPKKKTNKRVKLQNGKWKHRACMAHAEKPSTFEEEMIQLPKPMTGFGIPDKLYPKIARKLPNKLAIPPPYFYYENVALAPKGVWSKISRFLFEIEPEFVDSKFFCAAARKRGYIHNLPTENRFPLLPIPPLTVQEALPTTKKWWPSWDNRMKLNCLVTSLAPANITERIRKELEECGAETPPPHVQENVVRLCRQWNLVWVGKNRVATLEPDEYEVLLGFPKHHTRGGGINRTERYRALGNAFQVDTVAYHLSVLKGRYPDGMNVLSLFSGIGGAEVALHRLGIRLKNVVSVEIAEVNRNIIRSWWEQTNQKGNLVEVEDVQKVTSEQMKDWINYYGGFDLIVGGSPCNNLSGSNRISRDGLEGQHSSLFYDYYRIVHEIIQAQRP